MLAHYSPRRRDQHVVASLKVLGRSVETLVSTYVGATEGHSGDANALVGDALSGSREQIMLL
jgi:hypothetical protein